MSELAVPLVLNVHCEAVWLVFNVYEAPVPIAIFGKSVEPVPPIVFDAPLNVTVFAPPDKIPPLFVQLPATVTSLFNVTSIPLFI